MLNAELECHVDLELSFSHHQERHTKRRNDIQRSEQDLWHYASWYAALDDVRKTVLIDMTFQLGIQHVLNFKKMIACLEVKDYQQAAKEMLASAWETETPGRCERMAMIMETGSL